MTDEAQAQQENAAETERPAWLPENFESPEALAESYKHAQRKITEETTARKALEENYAALSGRLEEIETAQQRPQVDPEQYQSQVMEAYEANPIGTVQYLAQQAAQAAVQQYQQAQQQQFQPTQQAQTEMVAQFATQALEAKYPDWSNYTEKIAEVIQQNPGLVPADALYSPQALQQKLELAYKTAKADEFLSGNAQQGQSPEALQYAMKMQAQSASGGGGRPTDPDAGKAEWDAVLKAAKSEPGRYWE